MSILITRHYFHFSFFFLSFDLIEFCFAERGCGRVSSLPNRLSSYVFFFLVNKRFQAQIAFNYKQPQVLR